MPNQDTLVMDLNAMWGLNLPGMVDQGYTLKMRVAHLPLFVLVFLSTLIAATSNATEMVEDDDGDDDIEFFIPSDRSVPVVPFLLL